MTRTFSLSGALIGAALVLVLPAWGQAQQDAFERAVGAQASTTSVALADAFERAAAASERRLVRPTDAHQRTGTTVDGATSGSPRSSFPADAFERMLLNRASSVATPTLSDHNGRMEQPVAAPEPITAGGRDIEWPQVGIGFGLGVLLVLGLALGMRVARMRPLAH